MIKNQLMWMFVIIVLLLIAFLQHHEHLPVWLTNSPHGVTEPLYKGANDV